MNLRGAIPTVDALRAGRAERSGAREDGASSPFALPVAAAPGRDAPRATAAHAEGRTAPDAPSRAMRGPRTASSTPVPKPGDASRRDALSAGRRPIDHDAELDPSARAALPQTGHAMQQAGPPGPVSTASAREAEGGDASMALSPAAAESPSAPGVLPDHMLTLLDASARAVMQPVEAVDVRPGLPPASPPEATTPVAIALPDVAGTATGAAPTALAVLHGTERALQASALPASAHGSTGRHGPADARRLPATAATPGPVPLASEAPVAPSNTAASTLTGPLPLAGVMTVASSDARAPAPIAAGTRLDPSGIPSRSPVGALPLADAVGAIHGAALQPSAAAASAMAGTPPSVASADSAASGTEAGLAALAALVSRPTESTGASPRGEGIEAAGSVESLAPSSEMLPSTLGSTPLRSMSEAVPRIQFAAPIPFPARPELGLDDAFDQRIVWMADQRIGQAEMRVSPEGVGPIDVRLQIDGQRVTAQFNAAHPDVRQALEAGMERLRDLLGQRGMELADAHVGQQRSQGGPAGGPEDGSDRGETGDDAPVVTTLRALRARGLVDEYV